MVRTTENFALMIGTFVPKNPLYKENFRKARFGFEIRAEALKLFHSNGTQWANGLTKSILEKFILKYCFGRFMMSDSCLYLMGWDSQGELRVKRWREGVSYENSRDWDRSSVGF